jgi:hypothetical protein
MATSSAAKTMLCGWILAANPIRRPPKFPGANGLRPVKNEEREPQYTASPIGPAIPVVPLTAGNPLKTVKVLAA